MSPQTLGAIGESSALLYRPALWVLYAILISIYLLLRFVLIGDQWPTRQDLQLEMRWAAIGTAALIASSLTMVIASRAATSDRLNVARRWLTLTLLLGVGFAAIQASEFSRRWLHNLIPAPLSNSLHDRADLYYLSAVQQRLNQLVTEINTRKVRQNQLVERLGNLPDDLQGDRPRLEAELGRLQTEEADRGERLAIVNRLLTSEARWTSSIVATTDDFELQRMAIAALANDVYPHKAFAESHQQFRQLESQRLEETQTAAKQSLLVAEASAKENSVPINALLSAVAEVKAEHQDLEAKLKAVLRQQIIDEDLADAPEQENDPKRVTLEQQLSEVQTRLEERNAKLSAAAKLVTDAEDVALRLSQELSGIAARKALVTEIERTGLNQQYGWLRLPVCIPGGTSWAWTYFILTALHLIHLAVGLILILVTVLLTVLGRSSRESWSRIEQTAGTWHSVVIVWGILFLLIYVI